MNLINRTPEELRNDQLQHGRKKLLGMSQNKPHDRNHVFAKTAQERHTGYKACLAKAIKERRKITVFLRAPMSIGDNGRDGSPSLVSQVTGEILEFDNDSMRIRHSLEKPIWILNSNILGFSEE